MHRDKTWKKKQGARCSASGNKWCLCVALNLWLIIKASKVVQYQMKNTGWIEMDGQKRENCSTG